MRLPCQDKPQDWFPPEDERTEWYSNSEVAKRSKTICNCFCPLGPRACLEQFGKEPHGIIGGLSPDERMVSAWR